MKSPQNLKLRILMAQINPVVGDFAFNETKILEAFEVARRNGANLVTFPELVITGYPPEDLLLKKHFVEANRRSLLRVGRETSKICAIVGFVDRDASGRLYNAAAVFANKKLLGVYRKNNLPNYGVFDEKRYFAEGDKNFIMEIGSARVGLTICEDIWAKESAVYHAEYPGSVALLINISASPYHIGKQKEREALVRKLALRNRCAVLYQNLVGGQDELVFDGGGLLMDASGRILAKQENFLESLRVVEMELSSGKNKKNYPKNSQVIRVPKNLFEVKTPVSGSRSRAIDKNLGKDEEVYRALCLGTRDYVHKNGFKKVLIGLSGGIDSALVACVAVDALGRENVIGVTMPSRYTSRETKSDALRLAKNLGIECLEYGIESLFSGYLKLFEKTFKGLASGAAEENLQARIRGNILMALSNKFGHLVLTTGNKSELATGYCTLYGDMAGGFAVIKDVPKTIVFSLSRYRNSLDKSAVIPESIIQRPPTAELRHNQTDQDTLPPYPLLDGFLEGYVEKQLSTSHLIRNGVPAPLAEKLTRLVDLNEYKRRQAPPGIKITPRAFGKDRRMPITHHFRGAH